MELLPACLLMLTASSGLRRPSSWALWAPITAASCTPSPWAKDVPCKQRCWFHLASSSGFGGWAPKRGCCLQAHLPTPAVCFSKLSQSHRSCALRWPCSQLWWARPRKGTAASALLEHHGLGVLGSGDTWPGCGSQAAWACGIRVHLNSANGKDLTTPETCATFSVALVIIKKKNCHYYSIRVPSPFFWSSDTTQEASFFLRIPQFKDSWERLFLRLSSPSLQPMIALVTLCHFVTGPRDPVLQAAPTTPSLSQLLHAA